MSNTAKPIPTDLTPKPRVVIEKIGGKEWHLEELELNVFDDVALWNDNPRLLPYLPNGTVAASEEELEAALRQTRGYDNLKKSIKEIGQMEAVYAWRKDDTSRFLIFEGATRVAILRELARQHEGDGVLGPKFRRVKVKVLPPEFGQMERVILLARIHVRGNGVRSWGRYIEAKFIHDHVTEQGGASPLMSPTEMAQHMEKSLSWVVRLRDAFEFSRKFIEHVDAPDAEQIAVREFSTLEEVSKAASLGPKLRAYNAKEHDALRGEVFDMVKQEVFSEYRDARFLKDFHEDPDKWAQLKTGEKGIARRLASEVKSNAQGVKAKIAGLEAHIQRVLERGDEHGLGEDDVQLLEQAQMLITQTLHPGVRPFRIKLRQLTNAFGEVSLADVKSLTPQEIKDLSEAFTYFDALVKKHSPASAPA